MKNIYYPSVYVMINMIIIKVVVVINEDSKRN